MVDTVTDKHLGRLRRDKPVAFRRILVQNRGLGAFHLFGRTPVVAYQEDFLVFCLEVALDNARLHGILEIEPVARNNTVLPVNLRIVRTLAASANREFLRERHEGRSALVATAQQRNMGCHSSIGRIGLLRKQAVTRHATAAAAEEPLSVEPMGKLGTHFSYERLWFVNVIPALEPESRILDGGSQPAMTSLLILISSTASPRRCGGALLPCR